MSSLKTKPRCLFVHERDLMRESRTLLAQAIQNLAGRQGYALWVIHMRPTSEIECDLRALDIKIPTEGLTLHLVDRRQLDPSYWRDPEEHFDKAWLASGCPERDHVAVLTIDPAIADLAHKETYQVACFQNEDSLRTTIANLKGFLDSRSPLSVAAR